MMRFSVLFLLLCESLSLAQGLSLDNVWTGRNNFSNEVIFNGTVYVLAGPNNLWSQLVFRRPNTQHPIWIVWSTLDDTNKSIYGTGSWMSSGMDFANNGDFLSLAYNNLNGWDEINAGFKGPTMGHIGLLSVPTTRAAVNLSDGACDWSKSGIPPQYSFSAYAHQDGFVANSACPDSDAFTVWRDDNYQRRAILWHQGSGTQDWRIQMDTWYDLVFYCAGGQPGCNPGSPGIEVLRLKAGAVPEIIASVPIRCKEISDLQNDVAVLNARITYLQNRLNGMKPFNTFR